MSDFDFNPLLSRILKRVVATSPPNMYYWSVRSRTNGGFSFSQTSVTPEESRAPLGSNPHHHVHRSFRETETWDTPERALMAYIAYHDGRDMAALHRHGTGTPDQLCPFDLASDGARLWLRGYQSRGPKE